MFTTPLIALTKQVLPGQKSKLYLITSDLRGAIHGLIFINNNNDLKVQVDTANGASLFTITTKLRETKA